MSEHINPHTGLPTGQGHERTDVNPKAMLYWTVGLVGFLFFCMAVIKVFYHYTPMYRYSGDQPVGVHNNGRTPEPIEAMPNPKLQPVPGEELRALRAQEDEILNTYGWVDQGAGTVRIPIDRAIDLVAERGLPSSGGKNETAPRK